MNSQFYLQELELRALQSHILLRSRSSSHWMESNKLKEQEKDQVKQEEEMRVIQLEWEVEKKICSEAQIIGCLVDSGSHSRCVFD